MDRMIYVAMSGAREAMQRTATNNHNLANVDTTGFKAAVDAFANAEIDGPGYASRAYAVDRGLGSDLSRARSARPASRSTSRSTARASWSCSPPTGPSA